MGVKYLDKYNYVVSFSSAKDEAKKTEIIAKIREILKPYLVDGTIQATTEAIRVDVISVGETYPINQS